jgi:hypothetical protein
VGNDSVWAMIAYPIFFSVPWIAGIVWLCKRTPGSDDDTPAPSMGERARSRLDLR